MSGEVVLELLREARSREYARTRYYRALAGLADSISEVAAAERLNGLLADEHHHLSRVSARLLELGAESERLDARPELPEWEDWEEDARAGEAGEVEWYERALSGPEIDPDTRALFEEILESERKHRAELGGKWMSAS